jgi:valyl-tRNA synthetase
MIKLENNLEIIDIFNEDATMNSFGLHYQGKDRFVVRAKSKRIRNFRDFGKSRGTLIRWEPKELKQ